MKKLVITLIIFLITIGLCGCMRIQAKAKVDRMLDYINNKYSDDTFEFVSMYGGYLGSNVTQITVVSNKFPDTAIHVICSEVDGKEIFTDNYLNIKFEDQTLKYLEDLFTVEFGENFYLKYIPNNLSCTENGSSNTTFDEYIVAQGSHIYFSSAICRNIEDEDSAFETINKMFSNATVSGDIFFIDEDVKLSGKDGAERAQEYIEEKTYKRC